MDWVWDVKEKRRIKDSIEVLAQVTGSLELQLKSWQEIFFSVVGNGLLGFRVLFEHL